MASRAEPHRQILAYEVTANGRELRNTQVLIDAGPGGTPTIRMLAISASDSRLRGSESPRSRDARFSGGCSSGKLTLHPSAVSSSLCRRVGVMLHATIMRTQEPVGWAGNLRA